MWGGGGGGQGGCERRIKFFVKIFFWGGGGGSQGGVGWGVRVDVKEELYFFVKIKKKNLGGVGGGFRLRGGVRVDVNAGVGWVGGGGGGGGGGWVGWGLQGGCERRIKFFCEN